jgi:hypothetical protein
MTLNTDPKELRQTIDKLEKYASMLDSKFSIPGTNIRFGWDAIIGLIPGLGDVFTLFLSLLIIWQAKKIKASNTILFKMISNVLLEFMVGIIPVLGDVVDVYWKANIQNINLLKNHLLTANDNILLTQESSEIHKKNQSNIRHYKLIVLMIIVLVGLAFINLKHFS